MVQFWVCRYWGFGVVTLRNLQLMLQQIDLRLPDPPFRITCLPVLMELSLQIADHVLKPLSNLREQLILLVYVSAELLNVSPELSVGSDDGFHGREEIAFRSVCLLEVQYGLLQLCYRRNLRLLLKFQQFILISDALQFSGGCLTLGNHLLHNNIVALHCGSLESSNLLAQCFYLLPELLIVVAERQYFCREICLLVFFVSDCSEHVLLHTLQLQFI
mmetsp:Transcript_15993/g.27978  ORF Transcript_15993/g.27978 Transcript_15993/m.27978 type:complete len:217 (-) Transcript_15993:88-738(-)